MRWILMAVAVTLAACNGEPNPQSDMERWARSALVCPLGTLTWSVVEPDCGTVVGEAYTAPPCPDPWVDRTCHLQVAGCSRTAQMPVNIVDQLRALEIYCAVIAPETCCRVPPLEMPPGGTAQFYAVFQFNCSGHVEYSSPTPPPPLCP